MNVLGEIRKGGKLTQVQVRLIAKELEGILSFEDKYDMRGSSQEKMFVDAVMGHSSLSWNFVKGYLQA
ncbi:MAG: hypothetical protein CVT48_01735 [Thermoplasmata archaeon HGW-Thermoplasmata-1]|nr:MAG: hypothetical protein CVT48_01735 [Thermoplasmata archaeon HGW-Thermoplasmata-1]